MESSSIGALTGFFCLILIRGIASAGFSALMNARKAMLREWMENGDRRAGNTLKLAEDATRLITAEQLFHTVLDFLAAGALAALVVDLSLVYHLFTPYWWLVAVLILILGAIFMLILGRLVPEYAAATNPERSALALTGFMNILLTLLAPASKMVVWLSGRLTAWLGGKPDIPYVTEEEIKTMVDAGSEGGAIEDEEKEMIYSIFQFNDKVVREIMVPRIDMISLESNKTVAHALDAVLTAGHSRIPVYEGTIDKIIGVIYAKDLLDMWRDGQSKDRPVRQLLRPAHFVPESKQAGALLTELQRQKIHIAIVIDEYGGTAGLVTIEDLLEEIVGDIQDEYDLDEVVEVQQISPDEYLLDGGINLEEVNELLDVGLSTEASDTLGGYIYSELGKVPLAGDGFEQNGLKITVELVNGRRIQKVRVQRLQPAPLVVESKEKAEEKAESKDEKAKESSPLEGSEADPKRRTPPHGTVLS
jgi:putative hemolysin